MLAEKITAEDIIKAVSKAEIKWVSKNF
jgi:hypothetical protein